MIAITKAHIVEGIDRFTQGALAADEYGNLLLVYRGGFGGGSRRVGRKAFLKKYGGTILTVTDGDRQTDVALVAALGSIHFLDQFASFLREVDSMRSESRAMASAQRGDPRSLRDIVQ